MSDLWTEASRDHQAEAALRRHAQVMVRVAHLWPFLSAAEDVEAFRLRRTLADAQIDSAVGEVVGFGEDFAPLRDEVDTTLESDFATLHAARVTERQAQALEAAAKTAGHEVEVGSVPNCDLCKHEAGLDNVPAVYDARLTEHPQAQGSWANVCEKHFQMYGPGQTGTGYAQRLKQRGAAKTAITLGDMEEHPYQATCSNPQCEHHGTSFVHDDLASDNSADDEQAHCPDCGSPLIFQGQGQQPLARRMAYSAPDGTKAQCGTCGKEIQSQDYAWYHMARDFPHGEDHPAHPSPHKGAAKTAFNDAEMSQASSERENFNSGQADPTQDPAFLAWCQSVGMDPTDPHAIQAYQAQQGGAAQPNTPVDAVQQITQAQGAKTAGFPLCAAGCGQTVSADRDLVNISPAMAPAIQAAYGLQPGLAHRVCLDARRTAAKTADFGDGGTIDPAPDADATQVSPETESDEWALLSNTVAAALDDPEDDAVPFGEGASAPGTGGHTAAAPRDPGPGGPVVDSIRDFHRRADERCALCGEPASPLSAGHLDPAFDADHAFSTNHLSSVRTAETHGGYHLEEGDGGWYVVNHIGERKNNEPMSHDKALSYQRALMVNVPGAKEDAERHEENGNEPKHSFRTVAYYNLVNSRGEVVAGPYTDVEDANEAMSGRQEDNVHVEPADEGDDSEGEFWSHGSLVTANDSQRIADHLARAHGVSAGPATDAHYLAEMHRAQPHDDHDLHDLSSVSAPAADPYPATANPDRTRVGCRKCVAGHDPSGGDCDYCDGQGSLDLTLAMIKAADGWDQGITREAFVREIEDKTIPAVEAAWADTKADLVRHHGKEVALTYNDDLGVNTAHGKLSYNGDTVQVGDHPPIKSAYVLDVQPTGTGDARDPREGPGKDNPSVMDRLVRLWPSGASASRRTAQTPVAPMPGAGQDMTRYLEQMRDTQQQLTRQTAPAQPPGPETPAAPPAPASAPVAPAVPPSGNAPRATTTRPRQQPRSNHPVQQGFAALVQAQDSHLSPPVPNAEAFEQKVDEIAADIQNEHPDIAPAVARRLAVAAVRRYPETVQA